MDIDIISDEFKLNQADRYSLWLYINDNSCSLSILDDKERLFVGIKQAAQISLAKTVELLDELSSISFSKVYIAVDTTPALLVPQTLYRPENKRNLLAFSADFNEEHEVMEHPISSLTAVMLFPVASSFKSFVIPFFPNAEILHILSALPVAMFELSRATKGQAMGARITKNLLHVSIADFGKLLFSNHFEIKTKDDIVYWLLRVCDQFTINPRKQTLYLDGIPNLMDDIAINIKSYFPTISLIPFPSVYGLASDLKSKPLESFTDLFYLPLCEL